MSPAWGGQQPRAGAVAVSDTGLGPLIAVGADPLGRFDLDQLLHHQPDRVADQLNAFAGTERVQQLGQDRLSQGHRWLLLQWVLGGTHRESRRWPHREVDP